MPGARCSSWAILSKGSLPPHLQWLSELTPRARSFTPRALSCNQLDAPTSWTLPSRDLAEISRDHSRDASRTAGTSTGSCLAPDGLLMAYDWV